MNEYYVDGNSKKIGSGTADSPWRTVQYALDKIKQGSTGDIIYVSGTVIQKRPLDLSKYGATSYNRPLMIIGQGGTIDGDGSSIYSGPNGYLVFDSLRLCNSGTSPLLAFGGPDIYVTNCMLFNSRGGAIVTGLRTTVGGCSIYDIGGTVAIYGAESVYVYRNSIDNSASVGIDLRGGTASGNVVKHHFPAGAGISGAGRITENTVVNKAGESSTAVGIRLSGNQLVANNYVIGFGIAPESASGDTFTLSFANAITEAELNSFAIDLGNVSVGDMTDGVRGVTAKGYIEGWPSHIGETKVGVNRGASQVPPAELPDYPDERNVRHGVKYADGTMIGKLRQTGGGGVWR